MDGGIAAPAFTFRFSIPVFTLGVFSTNESLCTEVVTCGERDKGSLDVVGPKTFACSKQEACTLHRDERKSDKCKNEPRGSYRASIGDQEFSAGTVGSFSITARKAAGSEPPHTHFKVTSAQIDWLPL